MLDAVRDYIQSYSGLAEGVPVWVEYLGKDPIKYSVVSLPGTRTLQTFLDESKEMAFSFGFQSAESTVDDLTRTYTADFYEAFSDWLEGQSDDEVFPNLGPKCEVTKIEAVTSAFVAERADSPTAVYQVMCRLTYIKKK